MKKLLVHLIDDNDIDIAVNSKLLSLAKIGDEMFLYAGGFEFLERLQNNAESFKGHRNLVLLDIMMPGMNGFDCMRKFNQLDEKLLNDFEVYMLSSSIDRNDIKNAEETPRVRQVLEKPLDVYLLRRLLES